MSRTWSGFGVAPGILNLFSKSDSASDMNVHTMVMSGGQSTGQCGHDIMYEPPNSEVEMITHYPNAAKGALLIHTFDDGSRSALTCRARLVGGSRIISWSLD